MSDIEKFPTPKQAALLRLVVAACKSGERDVVGTVHSMMSNPPAREIIASVVSVVDAVGLLPGETADDLIVRLRKLYREAVEADDYEPEFDDVEDDRV